MNQAEFKIEVRKALIEIDQELAESGIKCEAIWDDSQAKLRTDAENEKVIYQFVSQFYKSCR